MENSMNSRDQAPQIIVRRNIGDEKIEGWTGCNPMLIPMEQHSVQPP